jgi:hypothetical protein
MDEFHVEQVAQAFHDVENAATWSDQLEPVKEQYRYLARIAIGTFAEQQERIKPSWPRLPVPSRSLDGPEQPRSCA